MSHIKKAILFLLLTASLCSPAAPAPAAPADAPRPGVVLVLSGGGLRGLAHVGVMKVLAENDIPVAGIVGTSMGALVGGLAAVGHTPDQIVRIVAGIDLAGALAEHNAGVFVHAGAHKDMNNSLSGYSIRKTKTGEQAGPLGFFSAMKLFEKFTDLVSGVEAVDFMRLPIPYAAVATDIETGEKVVLRSGSVAGAMRASMAIPGLFEPWKIGDRLLVDGGLVSNLPVLTAREIFAGYPIVAVDVTDIPGRGGGVKSIVDVLDKSLTILTHKNVIEERQYADVLISPEVHDFGIFDEAEADSIIEVGIKAANENLDSVKALLKNAAQTRTENEAQPHAGDRAEPSAGNGAEPHAGKRAEPLVRDVVVTGLPPRSSALIRDQYLHWIGRPADTKAIIEASREIAGRYDILAADYSIERNGNGVTVYLEAVTYPDSDWGISGYTTNIDPYRWVYVRGIVRNVLSDRDALYGLFKVGEEWGMDLNYRTAPNPINSWEFRYSLQTIDFDSLNAGDKHWRQQGMGVSRSFKLGDLDLGLGYAYEYLDGTGGSGSSSGPALYASLNTLDVPSDPTSGSAFTLSAWWADFDSLLFRADYFQPLKLSQLWRTYLRLGYAEGDSGALGHAVYLGAAEELYSAAAMPIEAERMAWANIAFRRVISRGIFGTVTGEIFAGLGYAWDKETDETYTPWESGLAVTIPNNIIDTKFAVFYTSEREWRFGFFIGSPIWDRFPRP